MESTRLNTIEILNLDRGETPSSGTVVALGNFDGMHRGHQTLFRVCHTVFEEEGWNPSVLLFKQHTREMFLGERYPQIQSFKDKVLRARAFGIQTVLAMDFTRTLMAKSPVEFVEDVLLEQARAKAVVVGPNYTFGYKATGTVDQLQQLAEDRGFRVYVAPEVMHDGVMINSTRIRSAIRLGHMETAAHLLGSWYRIRGTVVPGAKRGRKLGFPTANLQLHFPYVIPKDGVYFTWCSVGTLRIPALTNIGHNPTFGAERRKIEVHLLDFAGDLYGLELSIEFVQFIREDMRFPNAEALIEQMRHDETVARNFIIDSQLFPTSGEMYDEE